MSMRRSMFLHLLRRGLLGRGNRPLIAFVALTVAATMITAMLNLYTGLENKLHRDFRAYGANVTIAAVEGQSLASEARAKAASLLPSDAVVVPFAFALVHTRTGQPLVVAGTDIAAVRELDRWWLVSAWPNKSNDALVGSRAASHLDLEGSSFTLDYSGHPATFSKTGTLNTGGPEEDRIYVPLSSFLAWTGLQPSLLEISVPGSRTQVADTIARLREAFPDAHVEPVRQLQQAEGAVISRMRSVMLASTLLITLTVGLCVFSTLTSSVLERRRDFAVMKAIGSSQKTVNALFATESLAIALSAALIGYALGCGLAAWISAVNFHVAVTPQVSVLPLVVLASMVLALLSAVLPLSQLQRIQPAGILKGE